jgi:hypothetical protein
MSTNAGDRQTVTAMIKKKPGLFLLEKLQTIHLFEAKHNWLLGLIFQCRMVCGVEEHDLLLDSQWGACPG